MASKKVVLVRITVKEVSGWAPLGPFSIASHLHRNGWGFEIVHVTPDEVTRDLADKIVAMDPLYVGFSVITGDRIKANANLSRWIKERAPEVPIVWGNVHPTMTSAQCVESDFIDYVVMGEGEITALELAKGIESGQDPHSIQGIAFSSEGKAVVTEKRPLIYDLENYLIDWSLFELDRYLTATVQWDKGATRVLPYFSSRGCPFECSFCYIQALDLRRFRAIPEDVVVEDILSLKHNYDVHGVVFFDDYFFTNKKRAINIVKRIDMPFYGECRADAFTEEFADALGQTKCHQILIGVESGSQRILRKVQKRYKPGLIRKSFGYMAKYPQIHLVASTIMGIPGETREELKSTLRLTADLMHIHPNVGFTSGWLIPFPGTPIWQDTLDKGLTAPKTVEEWDGFDRWTDQQEITWSDWFTTKLSVKIRFYIWLMQKTRRTRGLGWLTPLVERRFLTLADEGKFLGLIGKLEDFLRARYHLVAPLWRFLKRTAHRLNGRPQPVLHGG